MHACMGPVRSHCSTSCLLQDVRTGVSDDHSPQSSAYIGASTVATSSATVAIDQRCGTPMSSSHSSPDDEDDYSAPPTPPNFTRVGGAPHWRETSARTSLVYIHPQTVKCLTTTTAVRPEKVGRCCGSNRNSGLLTFTCCGLFSVVLIYFCV